jgi:hypothetical protein
MAKHAGYTGSWSIIEIAIAVAIMIAVVVAAWKAVN